MSGVVGRDQRRAEHADRARDVLRRRVVGARTDRVGTRADVAPGLDRRAAGIDQMQANVNAGGTANIQIRFVLEANLEDAANAVREKVAGAMRNVPPETLPPVNELNPLEDDGDETLTPKEELELKQLEKHQESPTPTPTSGDELPPPPPAETGPETVPDRRGPATPTHGSSATSASSLTSTTGSRRWPTGCSS